MSKVLSSNIIDNGCLSLSKLSTIDINGTQIPFEDIIKRIEKLEQEFLNFKNMKLLGLLDDEQ